MPTMDIMEPTALPRSDGGKAAITIAMPVPWVIAAPPPWTSRDRIRSVRLVDAPAAIAPKTNTKDPRRYTLFNPIRSASRPMGSNRALMARAYPMTIHCAVGITVLKYRAIDGRATLTLPWSTTEAKVPTETVPKTHHL